MVNHFCHPHFMPQGKDVLSKVEEHIKGKKNQLSTFFSYIAIFFSIKKYFIKSLGQCLA